MLDRRLAASVNLFPIQSMYWWQGNIIEGEEWVILVKTVARHFAAVSGLIRGMHSYELPAIMRLPVSGVDSRYLDWLEAETRSP